jgi:hypothetical protein
MHHLVAEEAGAHLAEEAHALAGRELLHLAGIEVEEAHPEIVPVLGELHHQRAARTVLHLGIDHLRLDQHRLAGARLGERRELRLVLVAQRQVQGEVELRPDAQLLEPRVEGAFRARRRCDLHAPGVDPRCMMASISTRAPRGSDATPTATRAG